ncbi:MAG: hypothetical protein ACK4FK_05740 [Ferrovibrio sp.]|uniref:hypothetical protein n=1 Tax=Ferrovibrio sp. TaxID=1917215 RepID=UPI003919AA1F
MSEETPAHTSKQNVPTDKIGFGHVARLAFVAFATVMAGYWLLKPYVNFDGWFESAYVKECKALIAQTDGVRGFRAEFRQIETGETYKIGEPSRTTGHYTALALTYGQAHEVVYCHADIAKNFTKAEITIPQIGCLRYFPTGQREVGPAC